MKKKKGEKMKITVKDIIEHTPNKMHLDAQQRFPARVHEDKRRKKDKHPKKFLENID